MSRGVTRIGSGLLVVLVIVVGACGGGGQSSAIEEEQEEDHERRLLATDSFELDSGLAIVEMTHQGEGTFVVNLLSAKREESPSRTSERIEFSGDQSGGSNTEEVVSLVDGSGPIRASRAVGIPAPDSHLFEVKADGPWTIEVEQPSPSSAPEITNFGDDASAATPAFQLSSGPKQVTVTNPLRGALVVSLLDKEGQEVEPAFVNEIHGYTQPPSEALSTMLDVPEEDVYLFDVQADNLWTIEISDAEQPPTAVQASPAGQSASTLIGLDALIGLAWIPILVLVLRRSARV